MVPAAGLVQVLGKDEPDVTALLIGKEEHGINCFWRGEFNAARALFEQCHGLNEPSHRAVYNVWSVQDQYNQTIL
jgi:hypothetical protein